MHEEKLNACLAGQFFQGNGDVEHPASWIPDSVGQLSIGHERKSGRGIKRTQPHVHILECEGSFQARVLKVRCHVAIMVDERLHLEDKGKIAELKKVRGLAKIRSDEFFNSEMVVAMALIKVSQETVETSMFERFKLFLQ